jgi:choline-sulfatase
MRSNAVLPISLLGWLFAGCWMPSVATATRPPNLLVIMADDQSPFDLRIYNPDSELDTPVIDRLAARGMVIDGAYHMGSFIGAVCLPSRMMIMSGRSLWRLPKAPHGERNCPPHLEQQTMPAVFNRAGYATMRTCKVGNSYDAANRLFSVRDEATKRGDTPETGSAWHAERVLDYLQQRQELADQRPFLIYYGFSHPHDPRDGAPEMLAKYGATNHTDEGSPPSTHPLQPKLPANYLPGHPFDMTHADVRDEVAVSGVWRRRDEATVRNELGRQFACSEDIDRQVGRVLERLQAMGELDNTLIIYTADHGMAIGRHGLMGKQNLYQHTWRVPLIVAGPGVVPGSRAEGNVYLMDLLATLCDFAGVQPPETNEGVSFRPVLEGQESTVRDCLYGVYSGGSKPGIRSVKKGPWKLIRYEAPDRGISRCQLFHLETNPHELLDEHRSAEVQQLLGAIPSDRQIDLSRDPQYSKQLEAMQALLVEQMQLWDDPDLAGYEKSSLQR